MYIRKVEKKNKGLDKYYVYYRLVHGYKIGSKVRQQTLLNLGKLEGFPTSKHKALAVLISTEKGSSSHLGNHILMKNIR